MQRSSDTAHRYTFRIRENLKVALANPEQLMTAAADGVAIYAVTDFSRQDRNRPAAKDGALDRYPKVDQGRTLAIVGYGTVGARPAASVRMWRTFLG